MSRRTMHPTRWLIYLFLTILVLTPLHSAQAEYDANAEIKRLINKAKANRDQAAASRPQVEALHEKLKQAYLHTNNSQLEVSQILLKVRVIDAHNKALMTVKTGMLFTMVHSTATGSVSSILTDIGVMAVSDYLLNHYPGLFDTTLTKTLPALSDTTLTSIKKFQWYLSLSDAEIAGMIRNETPELAKDRGIQDVITGGKLSDDLVALYRAKLIIEKGTETEAALQKLKTLLAKKQQEAKDTLEAIDKENKRLDADIDSWERHLEMQQNLGKLPPPPPPLPPVSVDWTAKSDFPTAAANMRNALGQLKSNNVDCNGYRSLVSQAANAASRTLMEVQSARIQICANDDKGEACSQARQTEGIAESNYQTHVTRTLQSLAIEMQELDISQQIYKDDKISEEMKKKWEQYQSFGKKLGEIRQRVFTLGDWGDRTTREYHIDHNFQSNQLAAAPYQNELSLTMDYFKTYLAQTNDFPRSRDEAERMLEIFTKIQGDLENDLRLATAAKSAAGAAAHDIDQLAMEATPNLRLWGCKGFSVDLYQNLRTFKAGYDTTITHADNNARLLEQSVREHADKLRRLSTAYAAENSLLRMRSEADEIALRLSTLHTRSRSSYDLNDPNLGYTLWKQMGASGVTEAMVTELAEIVPKLADEKFAAQYGIELGNSLNPRRKPVLNADQLQKLRAELLRSANLIVPLFNEYPSLYGRLHDMQKNLDQGYAKLRTTVEGITGEPAPWLVAPVVLNEQRFMHPNDFPDPTAGVFEQLDKYAELAARYNAIMDKLGPWTFPFIADLEKQLERLNREKGAAMGMDGESFSQWTGGFLSAANEIFIKATLDGSKRPPPGSPFNKAFGNLHHQITVIAEQYHGAKRIVELGQELQQLANSVDNFLTLLARPGFEVDLSGSNTWIQELERVLSKDSEARKYQTNNTIATLLNTLSEYQTRLNGYLAEEDRKRAQAGTEGIRKLYVDFAAAYQARNLSGLVRHMTEDWKTADGADLRDLEDNLDNSFRVFDRIQFSISGLTIRPGGGGLHQVSYTATITGHINQMNLKHQETAQVEDTVVLTPSGAKIQATRGGRLWLQQ